MEGAREASSADLDDCARLLDGARAATATLRGGGRLTAPWKGADLRSALEQWRAGEGRVLLAGTYDEAVVGVAAGHADGAPGAAIGTVDCCYVEPGARRVGVGTALADALLAWFAGHGCAEIDAPALPGDRDTKQLFEREGFSARLLVLHRRLP